MARGGFSATCNVSLYPKPVRDGIGFGCLQTELARRRATINYAKAKTGSLDTGVQYTTRWRAIPKKNGGWKTPEGEKTMLWTARAEERFCLLEAVHWQLFPDDAKTDIMCADARATICHVRVVGLLETEEPAMKTQRETAARVVVNVLLRRYLYATALTETETDDNVIVDWVVAEGNAIQAGTADDKPVADEVLDSLDAAIHDAMKSAFVDNLANDAVSAITRGRDYLLNRVCKIADAYAAKNAVPITARKLMSTLSILRDFPRS